MATWSFDIEASQWDQCVLAIALADDGRIIRAESDSAVADWYRSLPPEDLVLAHYGGGYDFLYLISILPALRWEARIAGSAIISVAAKGHAECRDTSRLFPASLAKWTGQKEELGLPCVCEEGCAGYCSIRPRREMPPAQWARLVAYCENDNRALLSAWRRDTLRLEGAGLAVWGARGLPRLTFGAVAWHTAAAMAGLDTREVIPWDEYDAGRDAYFGGRTEVGAVRADAGHRYDINSAYPHALTLPVPVGRSRLIRGVEARGALRADKPGVYYGSVIVPETSLPSLPHRVPEEFSRGRLHAGRLVWATGAIKGCWTHIELRAAIERGARVRELARARVWESEDACYRPYVEHVYAERIAAKAAGDDTWAGILKFFANALTGKLAQQPEVADLIVSEDNPEPDDPARWDWLGGRVWARKRRQKNSNMRPVQAAVLTSRVRGTLLTRLERHEDSWIYCDTDSSYLTHRDDTDTDSSVFGKWGYEGPMREWRAIAPKLYRYRAEDSAPIVKAKGIPGADWSDFDALLAGDSVRKQRGVLRIRTSGGEFKRRVITRSNNSPADVAGTRRVLPSGRTVPLHRRADGSYV